ncbi:MAG TPA: glycosyl hydrolase family 18 protein [Actinocrinis sp.]|uniref:glycosyl hydrolase family 18 protein n=1 Tax=Actinocrinis sp. TaxID=1920516 RepID=UPI002D373615|nr:glycosyl hydrolase family 18 protein [Actinocrinis sp.]HZU57366.1 glycosyl hydrolase family 18 protein [Actinocrinis sp.]
MRRPRRAVLAAATTAAAVAVGTSMALLGATNAQAAPTNTTGAAATSGGLKIAYFDQWSIYQNAFYPKNLDTEGLAGKINYLIYDFENIDPTNLTCFETTKATDPDPGGESDPNAGDGAGDSFADYQKSYDSSISVDGTSDAYGMPIVGNFHQLQELEKKYPNLKVEVSLGGWTYSKYFSDVAATAASRQKFVSSCIDMFIKGNIPSQGGYGGPGTAAGIFSGFDIDWEYPGNAGGHLGNHYSAADKQNYTLLLQEFRTELNALTSSTGKQYTLSAAVPAGQDKIADIETNNVGQYLTFADVMSYDMHGGWESTGPTNHQAPIYDNPNDPMSPVAPGTSKYTVDEAVKAWTVGDPQYGIPGGFPASKLTIGVPFYYRGWTGVSAGANHGLFQAASGPATGAALSGNVPGIRMYKELSGVVDNSSDTFWDPAAQAAYFYDGSNFWTGEDAQSIQAKADYLHCNGLGGAMMFSLYDLDPAATLFNDTVTDVNGSASQCPAAPPSPSASASPTSTGGGSPSPSTSPSASPTGGTGSCSAPAWVSTTAYNGGAVVSYNGHQWTAKWWTQGDIPGNNAQNVWTDNGACSGGGNPSPSASSTTGGGTCSAPAWVSTTAYNGGSVVSYNGHKWTAKWWTQGDIPGNNAQNVWTDNGAC